MQNRLGLVLFPILLFTVPLSIPIGFGSHQLNLPAEPLIGIAAIYLLFVNNWKEFFTSDFLRHPISLASIIYLGWMILSSLFSFDLVVSAKYILVRISHWLVFFLGFWMYSQSNDKSIDRWLSLYALSLIAVVAYAMINNLEYEFRPDASVLLAQPFYRDHALLNAVVAMLIFFFLGKTYLGSQRAARRIRDILLPITFILAGLASIVFIGSRAAWLSLVAASMLGLVCWAIEIRFRALIVMLFFLGVAAAFVIPRIRTAEPITSEARRGSMEADLKSTFNFRTDVSNLERLNRYSCAWRMFLDRPIFGFGAGTFAQAYLPYQKPDQMTRISVTTVHKLDGTPHQEGRGGGAHSEYLQALSEGGVLGIVSWLGLIFAVTFTGLKMYFRLEKGESALWVFTISLGLVTFFVHGLFNNFLHSEELAVLFWGMLSYLVKVDMEWKGKHRLI